MIWNNLQKHLIFITCICLMMTFWGYILLLLLKKICEYSSLWLLISTQNYSRKTLKMNIKFDIFSCLLITSIYKLYVLFLKYCEFISLSVTGQHIKQELKSAAITYEICYYQEPIGCFDWYVICHFLHIGVNFIHLFIIWFRQEKALKLFIKPKSNP